MIPEDSRVEIDAKINAGYFTTGKVATEAELAAVKGRGWEKWEDLAVSIHSNLPSQIALLTNSSLALNAFCNTHFDTIHRQSKMYIYTDSLCVRWMQIKNNMICVVIRVVWSKGIPK